MIKKLNGATGWVVALLIAIISYAAMAGGIRTTVNKLDREAPSVRADVNNNRIDIAKMQGSFDEILRRLDRMDIMNRDK